MPEASLLGACPAPGLLPLVACSSLLLPQFKALILTAALLAEVLT